jgi:hypothetical protein
VHSWQQALRGLADISASSTAWSSWHSGGHLLPSIVLCQPTGACIFLLLILLQVLPLVLLLRRLRLVGMRSCKCGCSSQGVQAMLHVQ